jgi:hypothetical protein
VDDRKAVEWIAVGECIVAARDEPQLVSEFLDVVAMPFHDSRLYYQPYGANFYELGQPMVVGLSGGRVWMRDSMLWWGGALSRPFWKWQRRAERRLGPSAAPRVELLRAKVSPSMRLAVPAWHIASVYRYPSGRWDGPGSDSGSLEPVVRDMLTHLPNYALGEPVRSLRPLVPVPEDFGEVTAVIVELTSPVTVAVGRLDWTKYFDKQGFSFDARRAMTTRMGRIPCRRIALFTTGGWYPPREEAWLRDEATGLWWPGAIAGYAAGRASLDNVTRYGPRRLSAR